MPRVVPSQVVALIDRVYPWAAQNVIPGPLEPVHAPTVGAIVALVEQLPEGVLATLKVSDHTLLVAALAVMRTSLRMWETPAHIGMQHRLSTRGELDNRDPVSVVRNVLAICPDEAPAATTDELVFLQDPDLERSLRLDMSTAFSALANGEFKAASVLAGSVIEALLLWALRRKPSTDWHAAWSRWGSTRQAAQQPAPPKLNRDILRWNLEEYIEVARHVPIISALAATSAALAKDFRNLIHPGRAERLQQIPSLGSATLAVGAMQTVVDELRSRVQAKML